MYSVTTVYKIFKFIVLCSNYFGSNIVNENVLEFIQLCLRVVLNIYNTVYTVYIYIKVKEYTVVSFYYNLRV